jgi:hypothetical protein
MGGCSCLYKGQTVFDSPDYDNQLMSIFPGNEVCARLDLMMIHSTNAMATDKNTSIQGSAVVCMNVCGGKATPPSPVVLCTIDNPTEKPPVDLIDEQCSVDMYGLPTKFVNANGFESR